MNQDIIKQLREPFPFSEVESKVQVTTSDKAKGMVVFYLDSRAIQKRLDEVLGPFNWKNQYIAWQDKAQLCGIAIYNEERNEWVDKFDGAECSDIEPIKGGLSDSFKRAACVWGVGRYLYEIDGIWCEIEQRGKGSYIKDNQQNKLKSEYDKAVARIFGSITFQNNTSTGSPVKQTSLQTPSQPSQQPDDTKHPSATVSDVFTVKSIKPSGKASQLLELVDNYGELTTAYVKVSDETISAGSRLREVVMEKKSSSYGQYNLVNSYQLVA